MPCLHREITRVPKNGNGSDARCTSGCCCRRAWAQSKAIALGGLFVPFSLPPHHPGPGRCPAAARCQRIISSPDARRLHFSRAPSTLHHQLRVHPQHRICSSQLEQCMAPSSGSFLTHSTLPTSMPQSRVVQQAAQPMCVLEPKAKSVRIVMVALHPSIDKFHQDHW